MHRILQHGDVFCYWAVAVLCSHEQFALSSLPNDFTKAVHGSILSVSLTLFDPLF